LVILMRLMEDGKSKASLHKSTGTEFRWWRSQMLGGRTNHWGRISLRFGPKDLSTRAMRGSVKTGPSRYDDVKPYYDKVDKLIGVVGT
jgi:choline dehydrogenase-like flavoprotein